ncbi:peptidase family M20/M25/M40 [Poronia punctata]|nr:peptidase family M20/M25/M40 [Poronia punctata]
MMMNSEKGTLLPQQRQRAVVTTTTPPPSRWKSIGLLFLKATILALLAKTICSNLTSHKSHHDEEEAEKKGCIQVDPLIPSRQDLSDMDSYLTSDKFRNETIKHMTGAIQIPTENYDDLGAVGEDPRWEIMYQFADYLRETFPLVHSNSSSSSLKVEKINTHALLYTWQGSDMTLQPTVLTAHQDVVPVARETISQWTHPPYSGHYDGTYIWGRGASDCKNNLIGILEAVETLLQTGSFEPRRTIILSFGFDEETLGGRGAGHLAKTLIDRYGGQAAAVLVDEGSGMAETWGSTFAFPGVAEKGALDVEIVVRMAGGHSSIPPPHSGIGVAAELITKIEAEPYEPHFHDENPFLRILDCGNAYSPDFPQDLKKHLPWKKPSSSSCSAAGRDKLALEAAKQGDEVKYLFTTSQAVDIIHGGVKSNALPERTRVVVNNRVNVGDKVQDVKDKLTLLARQVGAKHNLTVQAFVDDDDDDDEPGIPQSIRLTSKHELESAPVTPTALEMEDGSTSPYAVLSGTTRALYGESVIMAPAMSTGNTDTLFYWDLTRHIFRFSPGYDPGQGLGLEGIHTVNERVNVVAHMRAVQWYSMFIRNMDEADLP